MSDLNEEELLQRMQRTRDDLRTTVIWAGIGWVVLTGLGSMLGGFELLLGAVIIAIPAIKFVKKRGGNLNPLKWKDYEVVTTYTDGSKRSDGGVESTHMSMAYYFFLLIVGCLLTLVLCFYLPVRYTIMYMQASKKPSFLKTAYPFVLLGLFFFPLGATIGGLATLPEELKAEARLEKGESFFTITNAIPENGYAMKISEVRYLEDGVIVSLTETEPDASRPFIFGGNLSRIGSGSMNAASFEIVSASGTYKSLEYKQENLYDKQKKAYYGVSFEFPLFSEKTFTMKETSYPLQNTPKNLLVFKNVTVSK
jgi:hypothetical protein